MILRLRRKEYLVIPAVSEGADLRPRYSLYVGDLVRRIEGEKVSSDIRQVTTQDQLRSFYAAHGVELWSDWRWVTPSARWIEDRNMPRLA